MHALSENLRFLIYLSEDFKARNTGHIINIGSIAGREPYAGGGIYCATKHAVKSFTGSLLRELVNTKIRVSEIQPGLARQLVFAPWIYLF